MQLSIVTTLYHSANYLPQFHRRIRETAQQITDDYELILVNDGSPDDSLAIALSLQQHDPHLVIVDLARNFGHHPAGLAGLAIARGDFVFMIDSDLEEPPECLLEFWHDLQRQPDIDVLYGVQRQRAGNTWAARLGGGFYWLFNALSDIALPHNLLTVRLMRRRFVEAILQCPEKNLFLAGIMAWAGFTQQAKPVVKTPKQTSTYTFGKRCALLLTSLTTFSSNPLRGIIVLGMVLLGFVTLLTLWLGWRALRSGEDSAWMMALWGLNALLLCVLLVALGIVGLYLANVYDEVKNRPRVLIKHIYRACR